MPLIDIIRFMTVGCLLLISIKVSRSRIASSQKIPVVTFTLCVLGYLFADWDPIREYSLFYVFLHLGVALPFTFWLLSKCLFDDGFRLRSWMAMTLAAFFLIQCSFFYYSSVAGENPDSSGLQRIAALLQYTLPLFFVVLAITAAASGRDADLIARRKQFRTHFILLSAALIFVILLSDLAFKGNEVPALFDFLQKLSIACLAFYFASRGLAFKSGFFLPADKPTAPQEQPLESDPVLLARLLELMDDEEFWRTEGLTISRLADELGFKEYKLRITINRKLGYRNFNDFLHSYRIAEACRLLSDPDHSQLTVLEIAFQVGYNSLAPFNKAFKQITGMTPTVWRRSKTA